MQKLESDVAFSQLLREVERKLGRLTDPSVKKLLGLYENLGLPADVVYLLVNHCIATGKTLDTLTLEEYKELSPIFDEDVFDALSLKTCVGQRKTIGGPAHDEVLRQIGVIKSFVEERAGK